MIAKISDLRKCASFLRSLLSSSIANMNLHFLKLPYYKLHFKYKHSAGWDTLRKGDSLSWVYHTWW